MSPSPLRRTDITSITQTKIKVKTVEFKPLAPPVSQSSQTLPAQDS